MGIHRVKRIEVTSRELSKGNYVIWVKVIQQVGGEEAEFEIDLFPLDKIAQDELLAFERGARRELENASPEPEPEDEQLRMPTEEAEKLGIAIALEFPRSLDPEIGDLDEIPF